jgi:uncharacterized protein (TIGR02118 family)
MIKVTVMYPNGAGSTFDMAYYCNRHIPMVLQKVGAAIKSFSVEQGLGGPAPGTPPAYLAMAHLAFESVEAFQASFGPHVPAIQADVPNYTNTQPTIQISEVKMTG